MPEGQQVVSDVHAVVVVDGGQLGQFLKVLPRPGGGEKQKEITITEAEVEEKFLLFQRTCRL